MKEYCLWLQNHVHCTLETPKFVRLSDGLRELEKKWHKYKNEHGWNIYLFLADKNTSGLPQECLSHYFPEIVWKITGAELDAAAALCCILHLSDSTYAISKLLEEGKIFFEENEKKSENRNVCMLNREGEKITVSSATLKQLEDEKIKPEKRTGRYLLISAYLHVETKETYGEPVVKGFDDAFEAMREQDRLWWELPFYPENDDGMKMKEYMHGGSLSYIYSDRESESVFKLRQTEEWSAWMFTAAEYTLLQAGLTMNMETICTGLLNGTIFHVIPSDKEHDRGRKIEAELQGKKYSCSASKGAALRMCFNTKEEMIRDWQKFEMDWNEPEYNDE